MMRALFSGVSGLRNHQTRMDVIGNNIANVNTTAFKASRVTFKEAFVQLVQGAARPQSFGGINPIQIGTGMNVASTDQLFTQGSLENTGQPLDLAIQGDGFFILNGGGGRQVYTRAGNFQLDADGRLVSPASGFVAQGLNADALGNFSSGSAIGDVQIRLGDKSPAQATSQIGIVGNLDASAAVGTVHTMSINVYDSGGTPHTMQVSFTKTAAQAWDWTASSATALVTPAGNGSVTFNANGSLATFTYPGGGTNLTLTPTGGQAFQITVNPGAINGIDGLAGFANPSNAVVNSQNGYQAGDLINISVDTSGVITGFFTNGISRSLAQIALATFNNPSGLIRGGNNVYQESANSGLPVVGFAGSTSTSTITPGSLEGSNVDISQEFTNMIITQRGFQANARVITTADEMLNELVNLRR